MPSTPKPGGNPTPAEILERNRAKARQMAERVGVDRVRALLRRAQSDLSKRIEAVRAGDEDRFTAVQLHVTMAQVKDVLASLKKGMRTSIVEHGKEAASESARGTLAFIEAAEKKFRGINQSLGLDQARVVDRAVAGTESSILARIEADPSHRGHPGVLDRYESNTIRNFEEALQTRLVTRAPWPEVRDQLTKASPFLQGAPAHWAERIARTESMHASNRAGWETIKQADDELGDMCKILSCVDDNRTGADSLACHGQIRRPNEPFESWNGSFMHPPDRPNDRAVPVPHRVSWPIPAGLKPKSDGEVAARWAAEGRKGSPPPRPTMTTIPLKDFGKPLPELPEPPARNAPVVAQNAPQEAPPPPPPPKPPAEVQDAATTPARRPATRRPTAAQLRRDALQRLAGLPRTISENWVETPLQPQEPTDDNDRRRREQKYEHARKIVDERVRANDLGPAHQIRIAQIHTTTSDHRVAEVERYIRAGAPRLLSALDRAQLPQYQGPLPVVFRLGGRLVAARESDEDQLAARAFEGRTTTHVHVVDIDAQRREVREQQKKAPVSITEGKPKTAAKPVRIDLVSPEEAHRGWGSSGAGITPATLKSTFGDKVPTKDSLERTWGFEDAGIKVSLSGIRAGYGGVSVSGAIMRDGQKIGDITRSFIRHIDGTLEVHHDFFVISNEKDRAGGGGEAMLRQSIQAYEKMGVDEVTVDAAWVGRYAWATFGYQWNEQQAEQVERGLANHLMKHGIEAERAKRVAKQVAPYPWDVAALDLDGIMVPTQYDSGGNTGYKQGTFKLGKSYMLTRGMWSGRIDLKDKKSASYQRAKQRLGL
jgi:hypothetical protein